MTAASALAGQPATGRLALGFLDAKSQERVVPLEQCWDVAFEETAPVRAFRWSRGLGHFPGWWWAATTGRHVGYESWLERDHVQALDFDREIVGIASQPFWLHWESERSRLRHTPDYFARRADGTGVVVDVRADDRIEPKDAEAFAVTAQACALLGWEFRRVGEIDPTLRGNVRWLARYRHPRCAGRADIAHRLREVFAASAPLMAGAEEVGDRLAVLPALFHLMWRQELLADLARARLGLATSVRTADAKGGSR
ncbi:TnsA-like heteromeric transposase endonuclease subunit [Nonomuraea sp. NPDC048916]|uniref:TnsA-like heteromeric transposase endonuclease subunit n=1 Tax=Nonomuraea sp. NPDC048916 TaxID=3154232 RepID=UPI00340F8AA5